DIDEQVARYHHIELLRMLQRHSATSLESNGHSPLRFARHRYAAIPSASSANPAATYTAPLAIRMYAQPRNAMIAVHGYSGIENGRSMSGRVRRISATARICAMNCTST